MGRKTTKFLITSSFIIMILTLLFSVCVEAYTGNPLSLNSDVNLTNKFEQGFYCVNHGMHYHAKKFRVYETGFVDELEKKIGITDAEGMLLSFVLGEANRAEDTDLKFEGKDGKVETIDGNSLRSYEPWQNYIWHIFGTSTGSEQYKQLGDPIPSTYEGMEEKFEEYMKVWRQVIGNGENPLNIIPVSSAGADLTTYVDPADASGNVLKTDDVLIADATNRVKFKIEYPWNEKLNEYYGNIFKDSTNIPGLLNLVEIKIIVNGVEFYDSTYDTSVANKLQNENGEAFKIGDKEAYIDISDLNYGKEASIKVQWNFKHYTKAQYSKLTPYRDIIAKYECADGHIVDKEISAYKINNIWQNIPNTIVGEIHKYKKLVGTKIEEVTCPRSVLYLKTDSEIKYNKSNQEKGEEYQDILYMKGEVEVLTLEKELKVFLGQPNIKLKLNKINSITLLKVNGVEFDVSVINGNIVLPDGSIVNPHSITTTDVDTEIEIKPDNKNGLVNEITVVFKEVGLVDDSDYLMYQDTLEVIFIWDTTTCEWKYKEIKVPTYDNDVKEEANIEDVEKNTWRLTAKNRPGIEELSGFVWIDGTTGEKVIQAPNGIYDLTEGFKSGVKVYLYRTDGTQVEYDGYGERFGAGGEGYVVTGNNGAYEFKNLPKLDGLSYYIVFEYDGINYICTQANQKPNSGLDSKADEANRAGYNARFKTISAGQSNDGTALTYSYDGKTSKLITENGDGTVKEEFAIQADTQTAGNTFNSTATDINLGIVKKVVDLALMTDLHQATATINGIKKTLPYNTKFDNDMNAILEVMQDKTADDINYNINLYKSDYNYRIGNYISSSSMSHGPSLDSEEQAELQNSREELELILEYMVILSNQSTTDADIEEFEFYYDSHLEFKNITGGIATKEGNKLIITPNNSSVGMGGYTQVKLEFKAINLGEEQTIKNYAEITRYSTDIGGFVDCDSAPGNANISSGAIQYEDDTDEARGVKLVVSRTDREISGNVFEDNKVITGDAPEYITGNGIYDNGENKIDDVIVQLIEVKELTILGKKHRLEYIWQETTSGSNIVKKISDDGTEINTIQYKDIAPETGRYVFRGFIPGDYIVRFIYGDGTYKDIAINEQNILKYNGQDYKSTLDENYSSKYLISSGYSSENSSVARDNEARRLEVMAYALGVTNGEDLIIDSVDKLEKTWMAAETSKIVVEDTLIDGVNTFYKKANFGLVERPEIKLSLKKHIASVQLRDSTGKTLVQAGVSNVGTQYLDDSTEIVDFRSGVSIEEAPIEATATTRTNRGYWQVEANNVDGADLSITYKYIVTNIGEPDYLSQELANKFKFTGAYDTDILNYRHELEKCAEEVNKAIKTDPDSYSLKNTYLGQAYYTGKRAGSGDNQKGADVDVKTYVNLEDYLNTLTFDSSSQFEAVDNENKKIIDATGKEKTENVKVIRTKNGEAIANNSTAQFEVKVKGVIADKKTFPSYIAQIITPTTSLSGAKITGSTPNNLEYVQSYYSVARLDDLGLGEGTEIDEFWAETFRIVPTTGEDKQSSFALVIAVTSGLTVVAIGTVLIKKYMMK